MRAWDIPGWNTGAKIKDGTMPYGFVFYNGSEWIDETGDQVEVRGLENTDWMPVKEPKKKVKVKMYRPIFKNDNGGLSFGCPQPTKDRKWPSLIGWQETEIEYEEI